MDAIRFGTICVCPDCEGSVVPVPQSDPDIVLDLTDTRCPHLLITIIDTMRTMPAGNVLQVIATDLAAPSHVTAWVRQSGQRLLDLYEENGRFIFWLERVSVPSGLPAHHKQIFEGKIDEDD